MARAIRPTPSKPTPALLQGEGMRWLVFAVVSLGVWELGARLYNAPFLLPTPSRILQEFLKTPNLVLQNAWVTAQEIVLGFVLGALIAHLAAVLLIVLPKWLEDFIFRLVSTLNSIPFVALASLVVVWLGVNGIGSKVAIAGLYTFFALVYFVHKGLVSTDTGKEELLTSYNVSFAQRVRFLKLPSALPIIFTSLKGGAMAAVNGAIVGELFGAFQGLGFMILDSRYVGNTARVFLAAVCCTLVGWLLLGLLTALERRWVGWHLEMTRQR
ncbi:ABC transporter permease [Meiothermus granaticius]|uniref:Riboflavin transport system permease protein RibX n=1 Tax=Meiothermus granaticius NBRC 107808 TaxID=1227551 RepID=A0A399F9J7_9DEIN|nr:ABC transporter permease [Meiothermus granaticius]MCL6526992.1 ABC transporter permease [Thermaceae bacterium]RIH92773.1 Riboflavin transport system permease protein RibX [Meiothermus granaticius NBRC 107808]GEM87352.1 ABC transporter permease [Meiothermus granaticius NBRC 107808]